MEANFERGRTATQPTVVFVAVDTGLPIDELDLAVYPLPPKYSSFPRARIPIPLSECTFHATSIRGDNRVSIPDIRQRQITKMELRLGPIVVFQTFAFEPAKQAPLGSGQGPMRLRRAALRATSARSASACRLLRLPLDVPHQGSSGFLAACDKPGPPKQRMSSWPQTGP